MKIIVSNGHKIIFDDEDVEMVLKNGVCAKKQGINSVYAIDRRHRRIHRVIMGVSNPKVCVDHINGDTLDNRKANLRCCTHSQNTKNRKKTSKQTSSKFKGVHWYRDSWMVFIRVNYKRIYLGVYRNEVDAAKAYNEAAVKYFGEFAKLNEV